MRITYIALIKSPAVNFSQENHMLFPAVNLFQVICIALIKYPSVNFHKRITYHALIKSPAVNFPQENHLYYFDQIPSC